MDKAICHICIKDTYLRKKIKDEGKPLRCSVCGASKRNAIKIQRLGQIMEPIMRAHFQPGPVIIVFGENESGDWEDQEQQGNELSYIVQELLGQDFDFEDEIIEAIIEAEDCRPQDGDTPLWEATNLYIETRTRTGRYLEAWNQTLFELKYGRRFFSASARKFFDELFHDIDNIYSRKGAKYLPVSRELPIGTNIFRARICNSRSQFKEFYSNPMKHVGPPPAESARPGRMNAEGVAVLYAAHDIETCVAEMRPALGSEVAIIGMQTTHALRILDFSLLNEARSLKGLSYFQPDLNDQIDRSDFLRQLHKLISQPVVPGREADYIITQTMAEYLAHVHDKSFDGISFSSVQRDGGMNIVLFAENNYPSQKHTQSFRVKYIDDSIKLLKTSAIMYSHRDLEIITGDNKEFWINEGNEPNSDGDFDY